MLYVNDSVPSSYHYLVELSDNYYVLSNSAYSDGSFDSPDRVNLIYCYFSPSFSSVSTSRTYYSSASFTDISSQLTNDIYYARDFPLIIFVSIFICICICLLFNGISRLIRPHGIMF